jgi:hypothetical protein
MANRQKGEVSMEIAGTSYTLALTIDAMCQLEDLFSTPAKAALFQEVVALADRGSMRHLRGLIWVCLQKYHPDLALTDVSDLVHQAGGLGVFGQKLMELTKEAFADPKDMEELGIKPSANPPRAPGGKTTRTTGAVSTSTPAASA